MGADGGIRVMRHADWPDAYHMMMVEQEWGESLPVADVLQIRDMTICGVRYLVCYEDTNGHPYNDEHYHLSQTIEQAMHQIAWLNGPDFNAAGYTDGEAAKARMIEVAERKINDALASPRIERDRQIYAVWQWFYAHTEYHELWT